MRLSWIEACFEDYKTLTAGDTTAAAALVLAHAISSEESDKAAPLFGTGEAVRRLGISVSTLRGLVKSGRLTASRIGNGRGNFRFTPADLNSIAEPPGGKPLPGGKDSRRRRLLGIE